MATKTWTGATGDGSWATVGNWAGGVIPVTGDTVIVSRDATSGMSSNLNRSADGAGAGLNVVSFEIEKGFSYNIGSFASPLKLSADKFSDYGNGNLYFMSDTGSAALPTDRVIIDKDGIGGLVYLDGSGDSNITKIEAVRGTNVTLGGAGSMSVTSLWVTPRDFGGARVTVTTVDILVTETFVGGGVLVVGENSNGCQTIHLGNGEVDFQGVAIAVLNQSGGLVRHNAPVQNYPITLYNATGGSLITNETAGRKLISTLNRGPNFTFERNPLLTISAENYIGG